MITFELFPKLCKAGKLRTYQTSRWVNVPLEENRIAATLSLQGGENTEMMMTGKYLKGHCHAMIDESK